MTSEILQTPFAVARTETGVQIYDLDSHETVEDTNSRLDEHRLDTNDRLLGGLHEPVADWPPVNTRYVAQNGSIPENPYRDRYCRVQWLSMARAGFLQGEPMEKTPAVGFLAFYSYTEGREDRQAGHFRFCVLDAGVIDAGVIGLPPQTSGMADRPDEDATSAEIAEWMHEDFNEALAEGMEQAGEDDDSDE